MSVELFSTQTYDANAIKFQLLQVKVYEHRLAKVWKFFREGGFKPILIKGWVTARKYPNPGERNYVDFDLVFSSAEVENAREYYRKQPIEVMVDFHDGIRHLDTLSYDQLFQNSETVEVLGEQIRFLCEEDHLRVICVHWLNDGGASKSRLWDIYHAVNNRKSDFDWEKCLSVVSRKRQRWIFCAIGLCQKYLNLNLENTPIENEVKDLPKWLIRTVENEWLLDVPLLPLDNFLNDRKQLWKQLKKRFPPNAVQATIEMDGDFDKYPRVYYQVGDIFKRMTPSLKRIRQRIFPTHE